MTTAKDEAVAMSEFIRGWKRWCEGGRDNGLDGAALDGYRSAGAENGGGERPLADDAEAAAEMYLYRIRRSRYAESVDRMISTAIAEMIRNGASDETIEAARALLAGWRAREHPETPFE